MGLLHELPIAQGKRLSSRDMRAAEESRQAAFSVFVECLALHLLAKGAGLTAIAPCANTRECVSSGFSGIFGNDKHFFFRKISRDATHWNWMNCFYFLFSLKIKFAFLSLPSCCSFLDFLAEMLGETHAHWDPEESSLIFFLCELLEGMILANPNWIMIFRRFVHGGCSWELTTVGRGNWISISRISVWVTCIRKLESAISRIFLDENLGDLICSTESFYSPWFITGTKVPM